MVYSYEWLKLPISNNSGPALLQEGLSDRTEHVDAHWRCYPTFVQVPQREDSKPSPA